MSEAARKHVASTPEPASDGGFERRGGHMLHTHEAAGSSPAPPTTKLRGRCGFCHISLSAGPPQLARGPFQTQLARCRRRAGR